MSRHLSGVGLDELLEGNAMTFEEWLVREHGLNHGWTFAEVDAARDAWNASAMIEREACAKACEEVDLHSGDHLKNSDPRMTCAAAIRAR